MKAVLCEAFGPIENLRVAELPSPEPGPGQLLVDVKAASINFPDTLMVEGRYQVKPPLPFTPGAELAGVVAAVGEGVDRFEPGDPVIASTGTGAFAEQCVVDAVRTVPMPEGMDFESGASYVLVYGTSLHALRTIARLQPGETLLVLGAAGGVGIAAIEIAKAMGARVIAAASSEAKLALARQAGADHGIDYTQEEWRRQVDTLTDGRGADVVYDPVGGVYSEPALRATAWRGRYLVIGFAAGDIPRLPLNQVLLNSRTVIGVDWGAWTGRDPDGNAALLAELFAMVGAGRLHPVEPVAYPLDDAARALADLQGRRVTGKVVLVP